MKNFDINIERLRKEVKKVANIEHLKKEFNRLEKMLKEFDINHFLSPEAKKRLENVEKRYNEVLKALTKAQTQFDSEIERAMTLLKRTRSEAEKQFKKVRKKTVTQKKKAAKAAKKKSKQKKTTNKKTSKKKTTKTAGKKKTTKKVSKKKTAKKTTSRSKKS